MGKKAQSSRKREETGGFREISRVDLKVTTKMFKNKCGGCVRRDPSEEPPREVGHGGRPFFRITCSPAKGICPCWS